MHLLMFGSLSLLTETRKKEFYIISTADLPLSKQYKPGTYYNGHFASIIIGHADQY